MFTQIEGMEWFSTGAYFHPKTSLRVRPQLDFNVDTTLYPIWHKYKGKWNNEEFLDRFDVIYFMHCPELIFDNWHLLRDRIVVWRTIGQSAPTIEMKMQRLRIENPNFKIVRYSPTERRHKNYAGEDALIRFSKYPDEYGQWNGDICKLLTVGQSMKSRGNACGWDIFKKISEEVPCQLAGNTNTDAGDLWIGRDLLYDELLQIYRDHRVYLYTGTKPASYCLNFIEAWMTGIPVIAVGPILGNGDEQLYEVHDLISYGIDGYWTDDHGDFVRMATELFENKTRAIAFSEAGRAKAIDIFGSSKIKHQWEAFFNNL
jgi:hypothetical protein